MSVYCLQGIVNNKNNMPAKYNKMIDKKQAHHLAPYT